MDSRFRGAAVGQSVARRATTARRRAVSMAVYNDQKSGVGRERSPIEVVAFGEVLRVDRIERRFRRFVGGLEFASVEMALQLPALVPSFPLAT